MKLMIAKCVCGSQKEIYERSLRDNIRRYGKYTCLTCLIKARGSNNGLGMKNKAKKKYGMLNSELVEQICSACNMQIKIKFITLKAWRKRHPNKDYVCGACFNRLQDRSKSRSEEHRLQCSIHSKRIWENPQYREKMLKHLAEVRSLGPGPSTLERAVWRMLDDLGIKFVSAREGKSYVLAKWSFDVFIDKSQRNSNKHLLIEVDGHYRHTRDDVIGYDKAKETFVDAYHSATHEFARILEHEFLAPGRLKSRLEMLLNRKTGEVREVMLDDLLIKEVDFDAATSFLGAYHYLGYVNKRGKPIGCFLNAELIGIALFAGVTRDQTAKRLGLKQQTCRELIRFCLSPFVHNKNLGSWFLSRALNLYQKLNPDVIALVTFADMSVGHTGALYKATNFVDDGQCNDSYCWLGHDGFIMHKKTMWDHARRNHLTEEEMAGKTEHIRILCKPKHRFVYWFKEKIDAKS
ncbi:MAG: hypothetical protein Q8K86_00250 [Candidatus Nanopelagicaceae bacterium]|nr:hypothetical protein [Candidatus Nanopelagicaceae bacterium]